VTLVTLVFESNSVSSVCMAFVLFIIRLEARLESNIGFTFWCVFSGVHTFGYNCAESGPIWM